MRIPSVGLKHSSHRSQTLPTPSLAVPSVQTERSQSPAFYLKSEADEPQHKVTLQHQPTQTCSPAYRFSRIRLPTCSPRRLRMLDSSIVRRTPTYHASLPVWSRAAPSGSSCCSLPPSLGLNLILAAAKHLHQNLSDWRGAVS